MVLQGKGTSIEEVEGALKREDTKGELAGGQLGYSHVLWSLR